MSARLLISVRPGETLAALVEDGRMGWFDGVATLEEGTLALPVGAICLSRVRRVEAGLQAAFVELEGGKSGMLTAKDARVLAAGQDTPPPIERLVHEGQAVLVQISRAARDGKGPRVTADPALPGPGGASVRPRRGDATPLWPCILERAEAATPPALLWRPAQPDPAVGLWRAAPVRPAAIEVDHGPSAALLRRALVQAGEEADVLTTRDDVFSARDLNAEIDALSAPGAPLPQGGSLIIEPTSALTAIDVNAGGALGSTTEDTALKVNLDAASEIPRQIALRHLGGVIVIDFLRLKAARHRRDVTAALKEGLAGFRIEAQVSGFSAAGLVELVVPRRAAPLRGRGRLPCPSCGGTGTVPDAEGRALALLALVAREARRNPVPALEARAAPEVIRWLEERKGAVARELERFAVTALSWKAEPDWPPDRMDVRTRPEPPAALERT